MAYKILLINPPVPDEKVWVREGRCQQWDIWGAPFPPFSLAMISTQLVNQGFSFETRIIDSGPEGKNSARVLQESKDFAPNIIFLATTSPTLQTDLGWFAVELKKILPLAKIAAIGIHVTALPQPVLKRYPALDFAIVGEPEIISNHLVNALLKGTSLAAVKGIAYREESGSIHLNSPEGFVAEIDTLGFPDWTKIHFKNYLLPIIKRPFSLISFSRGCPYSCKFCATHVYNGSKLRKRSIPSLLEEIRYNMTFGVKDFLFWTELMTADTAYLDSFLDALLREGLHHKIRWVCNSRVDLVTKDLLRKMKEAGCWQIAFGFEFGDDRILQLARKGGHATTKQGRLVAEMTEQAGIAVDGHFMMGYPGETPETLQATIDYACSLPITFAHFYAAVPFPGAPLYEESIANGWLDPDALELLTQDTASLSTESLGRGMVDQYLKKAYRSFYRNPRVIARIYKIPKTFKEFVEVTRMGFRFYKTVKKTTPTAGD